MDGQLSRPGDGQRYRTRITLCESLHDMNRKRTLPDTLSAAPGIGRDSGFFADGYDRLIAAVETDARRIIEAKYAEEWNASGLFRRWKLQRKMDAEIALHVVKMMPDVSPDALF